MGDCLLSIFIPFFLILFGAFFSHFVLSACICYEKWKLGWAFPQTGLSKPISDMIGFLFVGLVHLYRGDAIEKRNNYRMTIYCVW